MIILAHFFCWTRSCTKNYPLMWNTFKCYLKNKWLIKLMRVFFILESRTCFVKLKTELKQYRDLFIYNLWHLAIQESDKRPHVSVRKSTDPKSAESMMIIINIIVHSSDSIQNDFWVFYYHYEIFSNGKVCDMCAPI